MFLKLPKTTSADSFGIYWVNFTTSSYIKENRPTTPPETNLRNIQTANTDRHRPTDKQTDEMSNGRVKTETLLTHCQSLYTSKVKEYNVEDTPICPEK